MSAALVLSFSGLLLWACAATAKPGSFAVADCYGAPLPRLRHRQGFIGDHRLQRGAPRCSVAAMVVASRSPSAVNTSMASFSRRRSRPAGSRRRFAHTSDAASLAACVNVCCLYLLPRRQRPAFPTAFRPAERSAPEMQLEWRTSTRLRNPMPNRLEPDSP